MYSAHLHHPKIQHQLFHTALTPAQEYKLSWLPVEFVFGSASKMSYKRASLPVLEGGLGLNLSPSRQSAFEAKRKHWVLASSFADFQSSSDSKQSDLLQSPLLWDLKVKDLQGILDLLYPKVAQSQLLTPTQIIYHREGMEQPIWALLNSRKLPLILRDTLWKFSTKTLPLFHKDKESLYREFQPHILPTPCHQRYWQHLT